MYQSTVSYLCVNTYFDTICVHPIKSAYSLLKCVQLNSQINWNLSFLQVALPDVPFDNFVGYLEQAL